MMITHGLSKTVENKAWRAMKNRALNPNCPKYHRYGGRGIGVCGRWMTFENFFADMGLRPSDEHSLDRIDNDGDYEPGNCRWATRIEQMRNQSCGKNNSSGALGVAFYKNRWVARIMVDYKCIYLGRFMSFDDAVAARASAERLYW